MLLRVAITIAAVIAAVLAFAATKSGTFQVQRSISINAPPQKIFSLINDFHHWSAWAPQDKDDPSLQRTYSGPSSGVDAISEWSASGSGGKGRMTIIESVPTSRITVQVDFVKPFEAHNVNQFVLDPLDAEARSTKVTWTMRGTNSYMMKVMSLFVNMDKVAGKHFESGLNHLKTAAEE
jgi:uncharacterized protein YndB with AHSA1/START domain